MPQEHYVLRCFSCETFQAHIVKKTKKWECKICGAKQSVKRNYGKGSGKDCRNQVMKLNELRLKKDDYNLNEPEDGIFDEGFTVPEVKQKLNSNKPLCSKWVKYLEEPLRDPESELSDSVTDICRDLNEKTKKRVKKKSEDFTNKNKKICRDSDICYKSAPVVRQSSFQTDKNFERCRTNEEITENLESCNMNEKSTKNCKIRVNNTLKPSKYAKFLDSDDEDACAEENQNGKGEDFGKLTIFNSNPNDLDDILSLE